MVTTSTVAPSKPIANPVTRPGLLHLLIVDEDSASRSACCEIASYLGFIPKTASSIFAAQEQMRENEFDILLLDLRAPLNEGLRLLSEIKTSDPRVVVVVMTAYATVPAVVEAMRSGAADCLTKPFAVDELTTVLVRAMERSNDERQKLKLRQSLRSPCGLGNIIGRSPEMDKLYKILPKVSNSSHPVLILGESGVGKELVARAIHSHGSHSSRPFVAVECGSLAPAELEFELFGYAKGAYSGSKGSKDGFLTSTQGGTVYLDEIGELPLDLQTKLLRSLQEKEVQAVGAPDRVPITVRLLAATNRNLKTMVEQGRFRKDLYQRLSIVSLCIPPLRERTEDIPLLAAHFLKRIEGETGNAYTLADEVLLTLTEYEWPGNVRELEHSIGRACAMSPGLLLHPGDLPHQLQEFHLQRYKPIPLPVRPEAPAVSLGPVVTLAQLEKEAILDALQRLKGDKILAARLLGIGKTTLYRKLKDYGCYPLGTEKVAG